MARIALCDARGPLNDLLQKLSGDEGTMWLNNLKLFNRGELGRKYCFPAWTTLMLGNYPSAELLTEALQGLIANNSYAPELLLMMPIVTKPQEIELVKLFPSELDLHGSNLALRDVYHRAFSYGYGLVPEEAGAQFLIQHRDLLGEGENLKMAMRSIIRKGCGLIFTVHHDPVRSYLSATSGTPCESTDCFVFSRLKK